MMIINVYLVAVIVIVILLIIVIANEVDVAIIYVRQ